MTLRIAFYCIAFSAGLAYGQKMLGRPGDHIVLRPQDDAVLEGQDRRNNLQCAVSPLDPESGFDLSLHSGYEVSLPIQELTGKENLLTAIFRVRPVNSKDNETYFYQKWVVPQIAEDTKGKAHLMGRFIVGEGRYQVDWFMRDRDERSCSAHWQINAVRRRQDKAIELRDAPGAVTEAPDLFVREGPIKRDTGTGLSVVVMLHVESLYSGKSVASGDAIAPVISILRNIAREPRIGNYSVTAFNLERRQVLFRREHTAEVDFPALGDAIEKLQLHTIDVKRLRAQDSEPQFLGELLADAIGQNRPDAVIFVGPKTSYDVTMRGPGKDVTGPQCPVFYLTYSPNPESNPWKDMIGSVVKLWKGIEYTIARPRDFAISWDKLMSHIPAQDGVSGDRDQRRYESGLAGKK